MLKESLGMKFMDLRKMTPYIAVLEAISAKVSQKQGIQRFHTQGKQSWVRSAMSSFSNNFLNLAIPDRMANLSHRYFEHLFSE